MKVDFSNDHNKKSCIHCGYWPPIAKIVFDENNQIYLCINAMKELVSELTEEIDLELKSGYHY